MQERVFFLCRLFKGWILGGSINRFHCIIFRFLSLKKVSTLASHPRCDSAHLRGLEAILAALSGREHRVEVNPGVMFLFCFFSQVVWFLKKCLSCVSVERVWVQSQLWMLHTFHTYLITLSVISVTWPRYGLISPTAGLEN